MRNAAASWEEFDVERASVDVPATQATLARESRNVIASRPSVVLTYGPGEREYVRVFPASDAAAPIVALVHGGAYVRGHPDDRCFPAPAFNAAGCTFASIGYPLAPAASLEAMVGAVASAVRMFVASASDFGGNAGRLHLVGHSAGANLAAMAVANDEILRRVRGLTLISGLYDLAPHLAHGTAPQLNLTEELVQRFSPLRLGAAPLPTLVACGERDPKGYQRQALLHFLSMDATRAHLVYAADEDHFTILRQLAKEESPIFRAIIRQVAAPH